MTKLLMLVACSCFLGGCWGSSESGPVWSECGARLHLPRDSYSAKEPESVAPYLDACTQALTQAGYKVVRDSSGTIFASKEGKIATAEGELPRTIEVTARSAPSTLDVSIIAKTERYRLAYGRHWTPAQKDAMTEMRRLVMQLTDLVDLRWPSPASK